MACRDIGKSAGELGIEPNVGEDAQRRLAMRPVPRPGFWKINWMLALRIFGRRQLVALL